MPKMALEASVSFLSLAIITSCKSWLPEKVEASLKVILPLVAVSLPEPPREELTVKSLEVDVVPVIASPKKVVMLELLIVLPVPAIVTVPLLAINDLPPLIVRSPFTMKFTSVVTAPSTIRF